MLKTLLLVLLVLLVAVPVAVMLVGRERIWTFVSGPADLSRYDFAAETRRGTGNDALACTSGACVSADLVIPNTELAPNAAIEAAAERLRQVEPLVERVDDRTDPTYGRFVVRTPLMRFPDTIDLFAGTSSSGETWLKAYSRSKLGSSDLGANRRRLGEMFGAPL
jgi:uncharacterized protein (DUF1499 family)